MIDSLKLLREDGNQTICGAEFKLGDSPSGSRFGVEELLLRFASVSLLDLKEGEFAGRVRQQFESYRVLTDAPAEAETGLLLAAAISVLAGLLGRGESNLDVSVDSAALIRVRFDAAEDKLHAFATLCPLAMLDVVHREGRIDARLLKVLELAAIYFAGDYPLDSRQDELLDTFAARYSSEVVNTFINFLYPNSEHVQNSFCKLLVLEDNRDLAEIFSDMLASYGYVVYLAFDGLQGLDHVEREQFDLIISDIQMPNLDGLSFLGVLRNLRPEIPVIITTGYTGIWEAREILDLGAVAFLPKPFSMHDLVSSVEQALARQAC
ncbi:MAG: response regulator [Calditrichaeota bacterium]|nr:response regulator [Calditrichota bacterium]MCB9473709.1 response regulator [Candidatus Delongbacteria bacterium]